MDLKRWLQVATRHQTVVVLVALLSTSAGADLLLNRPKSSELQWLGVPLLAFGAALFAWAVWPRGAAPVAIRATLANRFLHLVTCRGRLVPYFPVLGIAIVVADLAYNAAVDATPALLTEDTIVLLGAVTLIAYGFVPIRFVKERDFVLLFFIILNAILVVPLLAARTFYADFERSVDVYSWVALAPQASAVLNLLGVHNVVHPVYGSTAPGLTFMPRNFGMDVTVVITTACSGIYSFGIFASAFISFVLTEFDRMLKRIWALLFLGFLASYAANVLRMVVIVLVGYYTDTPGTELQNMLIAHSYLGWVIFLGWIGLFWSLLLRFRPQRESAASESTSSRPRASCAICQRSMSPAIPGKRCACGRYYHVICAETMVSCLACGRGFSGGNVAESIDSVLVDR